MNDRPGPDKLPAAICWDCVRAAAPEGWQCIWNDRLERIPGSKAVEVEKSPIYGNRIIITECPLYIAEASEKGQRIKAEITALCKARAAKEDISGYLQLAGMVYHEPVNQLIDAVASYSECWDRQRFEIWETEVKILKDGLLYMSNDQIVSAAEYKGWKAYELRKEAQKHDKRKRKRKAK